MNSSEQFLERIQKNNRYYERFAGEVEKRTEKRSFERAIRSFSDGLSREKIILDIGCGSGIHLGTFRDMGFPILGIEPSQAMRELCRQQGLPAVDGAFETLHNLDIPPLSGVWCASSLLHVPILEMPRALRAVADRLPLGGRLFLTVRLGNGAKWDKWDDQAGDAERFIQLYEEKSLITELANAGFRLREHWVEDSYWGRTSQWISIFAERSDVKR